MREHAREKRMCKHMREYARRKRNVQACKSKLCANMQKKKRMCKHMREYARKKECASMQEQMVREHARKKRM